MSVVIAAGAAIARRNGFDFHKRIFTRLNITVALIAVQVFIYFVLIQRFIDFLPFATVISYVTSFAIILWLVIKDESAGPKISWILVIITLPTVGVILYLLFGSNYPSRRLRARLTREREATAKLLQCEDTGLLDVRSGGEGVGLSDFKMRNSEVTHSDRRVAGCLSYINEVASYPAYANTKTKYYPHGSLMFMDMLTELASAEKFIFMEYFIIEEGQMWDQILEVLLQKAEEGVDIRLIFDDLVSQLLFTSKFETNLREKGIKTVRFNPISPLFRPVMNNRDHRKLLLIDGHVGFTGAVNIVDDSIYPSEKFGIWKDTGLRLNGDAVWSFTLMFIEIWNSFCKPNERISDHFAYKATGKYINDGIVIPYGDSPFISERIGENIYIDILNMAQDYVYIFSPFLIISEKMIYALQMAAKRGVDVRIVLPGKYDWKRAIVQRVSRAYYRYLHKVGIKIYETPTGYLHAKSFVCDDKIAVVGTVNLDYRSLYLHFECATLLYKTGTIQDLKEDALQTIATANEIKPDAKRRAGRYLLDAVIHLFAPVM